MEAQNITTTVEKEFDIESSPSGSTHNFFCVGFGLSATQLCVNL